jgi:uncharacterized protein (DUF1330 family)
MAKGYWIARMDVTDTAKYDTYRAKNGEAFGKYGAKFLVRGGQFEVPEGKSRSRHVVIEFESYQKAVDCYHSPEYKAALALRAGASEGDIVIIEGYDA